MIIPISDLDNSRVQQIDLGGAHLKANARELLYGWATNPPFYVLNNGPPQVIVGRYRDVQEVFTDPVRFSSQVPRGPGYEQFDKFVGGQFITQMDGAQHARLRRLLMGAFSTKRLAQLETSITQIINCLLDDIERTGPQFDAMSQYATQLVVGVLLTSMMNLDPNQRQVLLNFQEVQPAMTATKPGEPFAPAVMAAYQKMADLIRYLIEDRRTNPRSDFLGDLVVARDEDDRLDDRELFDMIFGVSAALATTPRSSSGAILTLYTHRDQLQQLIHDPSLIPEAVEECFRIASNGYFTFPRIATVDTEVGGTFIRQGMIVRPSPQAANYDPSVYHDPLRFDIHRHPKRIMTFGAGPHHCLGNVLGRMTIQVAIRQLLARFPRARLAEPDFMPIYGGSTGELRMKSLPMMTH